MSKQKGAGAAFKVSWQVRAHRPAEASPFRHVGMTRLIKMRDEMIAAGMVRTMRFAAVIQR